MTIRHYQVQNALERARMMRETWRPVGARLTRSSRGIVEFLMAHPPLAQGGYYFLTGLWPWVSMSTFLMITGPKTDLWLVQTVGLLIAVIGMTLLLAGARKDNSWAIFCLGIGSAAALGLVDVLFVYQERIPPIYLLDAVLEVGLLTLWGSSWLAGIHQPAARAQQVAPAVAPAVPPQAMPVYAFSPAAADTVTSQAALQQTLATGVGNLETTAPTLPAVEAGPRA